MFFHVNLFQDLRKELDGETSGNFCEALLALCMSAPDYDASEVRKAVKVCITQNLSPVY